MEEILLVVLGVALYLLWLLLAAIWEFLTELVASVWNGLTGETARRKRREEEARKEEEERQQRQRERQQKRQQAEAKKREQFHTKNSEVFAGIADLLSNCGAPAVEIMRAAGAIKGKDFARDPKLVVWFDVGLILASMRRTGGGTDYIDKLWEEVTRAISPPDVDDPPSLNAMPNCAVEQLCLVSLLSEYDKHRGTTLSSNAASTYLSIVSAVSDHCDGSLAAKMVADKYTELLSPYIHDSGGNGYAGYSTSSTGSTSSRRSVCEKCVKGYQLLDLPLGTSEDEVKQKRVALAQVLHSDHTGGMSKRTRDTAEEQLKSINAACNQIFSCQCARSTN